MILLYSDVVVQLGVIDVEDEDTLIVHASDDIVIEVCSFELYGCGKVLNESGIQIEHVIRRIVNQHIHPIHLHQPPLKQHGHHPHLPCIETREIILVRRGEVLAKTTIQRQPLSTVDLADRS